MFWNKLSEQFVLKAYYASFAISLFQFFFVFYEKKNQTFLVLMQIWKDK